MYIEPSHILLVDDEEGFRYAAEKTLSSAGYSVTVAEDYRDALARLDSTHPIDLLITDIVMPNRVNGFALARMAKMRRADIRVLYLTAYDVPTNEAAGKVLRKPIAEDELISEVRTALASGGVA